MVGSNRSILQNKFQGFTKASIMSLTTYNTVLEGLIFRASWCKSKIIMLENFQICGSPFKF